MASKETTEGSAIETPMICIRNRPIFSIDMRNKFGLQKLNEVFGTAGIRIGIRLEGCRREVPAAAWPRPDEDTCYHITMDRNGREIDRMHVSGYLQ